jgi:hypothetical protein
MRDVFLPAAAAAAVLAMLAGFAGFAARAASGQDRAPSDAQQAFAVVQKVLQHPRCQNCHIPGDAPLQLDDGRVHAQNVKRGSNGMGAKGLACTACHSTQNPPASYGPNMPPGAPGWRLPSAAHKMVFIGLSAGELCRQLKNKEETGGMDLNALFKHLRDDKLVLWGWDPGVGRQPVDVPHRELVAAFERWMKAGAPCPEP